MKFNILFSSIGRRVSLVRHFREVLEDLSIKGKLIGIDITRTAPAFHIVDSSYIVPRVDDKNFIPELLNICKEEDVDLVIPLIDPELKILTQDKERFEKIGTKVLISDSDVIDITNDKLETYNYFASNGIPTAEIFERKQINDQNGPEFPLLIKPRRGSAGVGVKQINIEEEFSFYYSKISEPIIQEFIDGEEFTLDLLVDFKEQVRCVVPRKRLAIRGGEVSKGLTVKDELIMETSIQAVNNLPGAIGPITIQGFLTDKDEFKLIEINPRFGGGHPLAIKAGADYPKWIMEWMIGKEPEIDMYGWKEDLAMLRYDDEIFVNKSQIQ